MLINFNALLSNKRNSKHLSITNKLSHLTNSHYYHHKNIKSLSNFTSFNEQSTRIKSVQINMTSNCINTKDILCNFTSSQDNDLLNTKSVFIKPRSRIKTQVRHIITSIPKVKFNQDESIHQIQNKNKPIVKIAKSHQGRNKNNDLLLRIKKVLYNSKVKEEDNSDNDIVNCEDLFTNHLKQKVRESLISDINFSANNDYIKERDKFYNSIDNKVNFTEDIFLLPHLMNKLCLNHSGNEKDKHAVDQATIITVTQRILQPNCLSKSFMLSMNKERRRLQYEKDDRIKEKKNIIQYLAKGNMFQNKINYSYDDERYFIKIYHYKQTGFANHKVKQAIYALDQ